MHASWDATRSQYPPTLGDQYKNVMVRVPELLYVGMSERKMKTYQVSLASKEVLILLVVQSALCSRTSYYIMYVMHKKGISVNKYFGTCTKYRSKRSDSPACAPIHPTCHSNEGPSSYHATAGIPSNPRNVRPTTWCWGWQPPTGSQSNRDGAVV